MDYLYNILGKDIDDINYILVEDHKRKFYKNLRKQLLGKLIEFELKKFKNLRKVKKVSFSDEITYIKNIISHNILNTLDHRDDRKRTLKRNIILFVLGVGVGIGFGVFVKSLSRPTFDRSSFESSRYTITSSGLVLEEV